MTTTVAHTKTKVVEVQILVAWPAGRIQPIEPMMARLTPENTAVERQENSRLARRIGTTGVA